MNLDLAGAPRHICSAWLPTTVCMSAHVIRTHGSPTLPEERNIMLEHILHSIDGRLSSIDKRLDGMDQRFDRMDQRLDRMDDRFDRIDERFDKVDERFKEVDQRFCVMTADIAAIGTSVAGLGTRLTRVEATQDTFTSAMRDFSASLARTNEAISGDSGFRAVGRRTEDLVNQMSVLSYRIQVMPSWKFLGVAAAGTIASAAGSVTWLMQGGASALSRWFE